MRAGLGDARHGQPRTRRVVTAAFSGREMLRVALFLLGQSN